MKYGDSLVIVAWHPYGTDTFNLNPDDSLRLTRYTHNRGQPAVALDGYLEVAMPSDPVEYYNACYAAIQSVKSARSFGMLEATGTADSLQGRIVVRVALDSVMPGTTPTLYCVVTEDSLLDMFRAPYFRVPRALLPDRNGTPLVLARGDTLTDTLTFSTAGLRLDKLGAALFLEDASGSEPHRVLQSATIDRFVLTEDK
jgi:hypothetical protein